MKTAELCRLAAEKGGYWKKDVRECLLVHFPAALVEGLKRDGKVRLKGVGVFFLASPPGKRREGVYVRFRPSSLLLKRLNMGTTAATTTAASDNGGDDNGGGDDNNDDNTGDTDDSGDGKPPAGGGRPSLPDRRAPAGSLS
ncbi:hypothetical protein Adeg_0877 [Ammonifex degensii KC4]|uniref:Uncharacterized protein n=1 Tax=Ammonifex degensii (strain DSM 10501 / KC4) TaxID=429009 RepID=C9RCN9_AMMDK|nr:hypothetical protein [Ammonifex degensii]ACX52016.1 hypothetical protein Adeg_0877 [Ammonifex degensii KC4]